MSRRNFRATTALGLCLAMVPLTAFTAKAQSFGAGADIFAPRVQACVEAPGWGDCEPVQEDVIACAEDLAQARCEGLFIDADAVYDDPVQLAQAQTILEETSDALGSPVDAPAEDAAPEAATAEPVEAEPEPEPEVIADEPEAEVEAETVAETEAEVEAEAEVEVETTDAAAEEEADADAEARLRAALEAEERAAEAEDAEAWTETTEGATEEATEAWGEEAPAEDAAPEAAEADVTEPEVTEPELAEEPAVEPETTEIETTEAEETLDADAAAQARADEEALEQEREQLRADAEAMATEEPELVEEEAPAEEFIAEDEAPRELDAAQQGALDRLMQDPEVAAAVALLGAGAWAQTGDDPAQEEQADGFAAARAWREREERPGDEAAATEAEVLEDAIAAGEVRSSRDDFESRLATEFDAGQARRDSRRDLERAGLLALGGLAVGMMINQNRVVARSEERVVVRDDRGEYAVWRDDDVILRQEGAQRRIERYEDGSSLSRWDRPDGSQIITIRDATGRVILRERVMPDGSRVQLVDDTREVQPINVSTLPPPRTRELRLSQRTDPELALGLLREAEADARALDRGFTLRQIREVREVRELVPVLSPDPITFQTNRANVRAEEAPKLAQVGRLMERLIADNPRALFLIEGHTDATGPASHNLALSDRRAESVALALTEFFDIPPENLIIQGYGERYLRIPTAAAEERNRRVAIRHISPLMGL